MKPCVAIEHSGGKFGNRTATADAKPTSDDDLRGYVCTVQEMSMWISPYRETLHKRQESISVRGQCEVGRTDVRFDVQDNVSNNFMGAFFEVHQRT